VALSGAASAYDHAALAAAMIGGELSGAPVPAAAPAAGEVRVLVAARALDLARESGFGIAIREASFEVRAGEIAAIAAVDGNGQRELLRAVAGRLRPLRGRLDVASPVGYVPEDRTTEGLIPALSLTENLVLGSGAGDPWIAGARVNWGRARARTAELLAEYRVVAPGPDARAAALSGGNQQRLVLARELARRPAVLVAENPTRGLDLRATDEVHARLRAAAAAGAAVLFHSSDLDEVLGLGRRILVVRRGSVLEAPAGASRAEVGALMLGGKSGE
jgi:ABC-type uncharacterized transport system ATPase subunit